MNNFIYCQLTRVSAIITALKAILVLVSMGVAGCAMTERVALPPNSSIKALTMEENIQTPQQMYYWGPGFGIGLLHGVLKGLDDVSQADQLKLFAKEHNIQIDEIVRNSFTSAIKETGKIVISDSVDSKLIINIKLYGLSIPHGFSRKLVPVLSVEAEIADNVGSVLWRDSDSVSILGSPAEPIELDQLKNNPILLQNAWEAAAKKVATELMNKLYVQLPSL